ncbi:sugar transferase [Nakamurella leprariae]|uniref:Sugar transferase n=1 Tax=Nakamurella leprariae TaxID=2803911 RepID=A0A938YIW7_9ACTN|nr:sugar transferase [Nakamurella leprariae]MBM9469132.1 sugar transferase [Nakamurella leprariae]
MSSVEDRLQAVKTVSGVPPVLPVQLERRDMGTAPTEPSTSEPIRPVHVRRWMRRYVRNLFMTDAVIIAAMMLLSQSLRFDDLWDVTVAKPGDVAISYWALTILLTATWLIALAIWGAWDHKVVGEGPSEYKRVISASLYLFGFVAIVCYLLQFDVARGYLALALPLGLSGVMAGRWVWRQLLREHRKVGGYMNSVLIIGDGRSASALARRLRQQSASGYRVVGLCVPDDQVAAYTEHSEFPVLGGFTDFTGAIDRSAANTVAVSSSTRFTPEHVRQLGWRLEGTGIRLCLAPSLTDVAGPRIHVKPVAGLPLLVVEEPTFKGPKLVAKTVLDLVIAVIGVTALSPVFLAVAAAIKITDRGPVFFRQERVGRGGQTFRVWKFRSMRVGADKAVSQAKQAAGQSGAVFYKSADDARITKIGRFIRKTSIDELPQLFNVLSLQMSIVGPRPLVPGEGAEVGNFLERRMLVKPGITGLWQVSGRSDVSAEERIRLDFYYVENWSVASDLTIIAKTVKTVLAKQGAY